MKKKMKLFALVAFVFASVGCGREGEGEGQGQGKATKRELYSSECRAEMKRSTLTGTRSEIAVQGFRVREACNFTDEQMDKWLEKLFTEHSGYR